MVVLVKRCKLWSQNAQDQTLAVAHGGMALDESHNTLKTGSISSFTERVTVTVTSPLTYCANNMQDLTYKNCS